MGGARLPPEERLMSRLHRSAVVLLLLSACGGGVKGTYSNESVSLDLQGGGKAVWAGQLDMKCTYTHTKTEVTVNCGEDGILALARNSDGSLQTPVGVLRKR